MSFQDNLFRRSVALERENKEKLQKLGGTLKDPVMAPKIVAGKAGNPAGQLTTNVYGVAAKAVDIRMLRYEVRIYGIVKSSLKRVEFTGRCSGGTMLIDRKSKCREVFKLFRDEQKDGFFKGVFCVYDLCCILYTDVPLQITEGKVAYRINCEKLVEDDWKKFVYCEVEVKPTEESSEFILGDLRAEITAQLQDVDRTYAQYLEILTAQDVLFKPDHHLSFSSAESYLMRPGHYGFREDDVPEMPANKSYISVGCHKNSRFVEGPKGAGSAHAGVVIAVKKTAFHCVTNLVEKARCYVRNLNDMDDCELKELNEKLKGLFVRTEYGSFKQVFKVKEIINDSADSKRIEIGEAKSVTVAEYFLEKYNINLKYVSLPLVVAHSKNNSANFYPMEVCIVCDNQRVRLDQHLPKTTEEMIKKSARILHAPAISFCKERAVVQRNYNWSEKPYLIPSKLDSWVVYALISPKDKLNIEELKRFVGQYILSASSKGMQVSDPIECRIFTAATHLVREKVKCAAEMRCSFLLLVQPNDDQKIHAALKLAEINFSLTTQSVNVKTVKDIVAKGQPATLNNLLHKTNVKLGGLNYSLTVDNPISCKVLGQGTLYIGIGASHPRCGDLGETGNLSGLGDVLPRTVQLFPPSIVGYAANIGVLNGFEFIGDFLLQEPRRDEKPEIICRIVERCVQMYLTNRGAEVQRIVIYRNGCAEGQFSQILKYEVPFIKLGLDRLGCRAKMVVIVPNRLHHIRFFATEIDSRDSPSDQNLQPGTVIDTNVVHPTFCEFYLNSHRALQGTARTPRYTVLLNELKMSMDDLQGITYQLCYGHQIVFSPTSLPSPVYVANCYAERGRAVFNEWWKSRSPGCAINSSYEEIERELCYYNSGVFQQRRINA